MNPSNIKIRFTKDWMQFRAGNTLEVAGGLMDLYVNRLRVAEVITAPASAEIQEPKRRGRPPKVQA